MQAVKFTGILLMYTVQLSHQTYFLHPSDVCREILRLHIVEMSPEHSCNRRKETSQHICKFKTVFIFVKAREIRIKMELIDWLIDWLISEVGSSLSFFIVFPSSPISQSPPVRACWQVEQWGKLILGAEEDGWMTCPVAPPPPPLPSPPTPPTCHWISSFRASGILLVRQASRPYTHILRGGGRRSKLLFSTNQILKMEKMSKSQPQTNFVDQENILKNVNNAL